jgi:hypothetical protein
LIPTICKDIGFEENSIQIDDEILSNIIVNNTTIIGPITIAMFFLMTKIYIKEFK